MNYPFPEVYIASQKLDLERLTTTEMVVDGQQRLTTIVDYIKGAGDFSGKSFLRKFSDLTDNEKKEFLNYPVSVKDLKNLDDVAVKEIFRRINATDYALNDNEKLNASYGGGEFAYFAKQLTDLEIEVSASYTNVLIPDAKRKEIINFFKDYNVFSNNDVNRMFDSQYVMLIAATILGRGYFSRSSKVITYLEEYNYEFEKYNDVLLEILNSINIIKKLDFNPKSYWFNKANLFTLIIEFSTLNSTNLNFKILESLLLELEKKVDLYFTAEKSEDLEGITEDERKYFEMARHGSHELQAREHRAKVVQEIIQKASKVLDKEDSAVKKNKDDLNQSNIQYVIIIPTVTALNKNIMDATTAVREFLKTNGVHDYEHQSNGPDHKIKLSGIFVESNGVEKPTEISMYKSNGRGDCRIWLTGLKDFANPMDELAIYVDNGVVKILNLNR